MQNKRLSTLLKTLNVLAFHNEATIDEIAATVGKNYSTILRTIRKLKKLELVKLSRLKRTTTRGKEKRYYSATLNGLLYALKIGKMQNIESIAKAHSDKTLTFKKWEYFKKNGAEQEIISGINEALNGFVLFLRFHYLVLELRPRWLKEAGLRKSFDAEVLGFKYMLRPVQFVKETFPTQWNRLNKIWKLVEADYELRRFREEFLHWLEVDYSESLKSLTEWKDYLKRLSLEKAG